MTGVGRGATMMYGAPKDPRPAWLYLMGTLKNMLLLQAQWIAVAD